MSLIEEALAAGEAAHRFDEVRLWRAVHVFRGAALVYAVGSFALVHGEYLHPGAGWAVLAAMAGWSLLLAVVGVPGPALVLADLAVATLALLATLVADDPERITHGAQTLPTMWVAAAVLGWAVWRGWRGGLVAALVLSVADVAELGFRLSSATLYNIVLLLLTGPVAGYAVEVFRAGRRDLAEAVALQATTRERERLAGGIHDSVLQVLAFVQHRAGELGGEAAELGRLAGEQEVRLRALVSTPPQQVPAGERDLRAELGALAGPRVTVTGPAGAVPLPAATAGAVLAAAGAALDNVARHAGAQAQAWLLVEDEGGTVTVTVRDDGVGMAAGRLEAAEREGRLGVSVSLRGRVAAVGGSVEVVSSPGCGTEVEIRVPRAVRR